MVTTYAERGVAKKTAVKVPESVPPAGRVRKTAPVQVSADLAKKVGVISQHRNRSITALIDPLIRDWVEAEFAVVIREMSRELEG